MCNRLQGKKVLKQDLSIAKTWKVNTNLIKIRF